MKKTPSEIAWEVKRYLSIEGVTMAEAAARIGVEKATIDEALAHKGDFALADIYIEKSWTEDNAANRRVLDWLFLDNERTKTARNRPAGHPAGLPF